MLTLNDLHPGDVFRVVDGDVLFKRGKASVGRDTRGHRFIEISCEMLGDNPSHRKHTVSLSARIDVVLVKEKEST